MQNNHWSRKNDLKDTKQDHMETPNNHKQALSDRKQQDLALGKLLCHNLPLPTELVLTWVTFTIKPN